MKNKYLLYIAKITGSLIYLSFKRINLRFTIPGKINSFVNRVIVFSLKLQGAKIGVNSVVRNNIFINYPKKLTVGYNTTLGPYSKFFIYSDLIIGDDTEIGPSLHVQTNDHLIHDCKLPLGKQGSDTKKIEIGSGVFIGANVTILKGVKIADLCIIAAGAVVVKDTESGFIYGGVPAAKIAKV